jgi:hypothetical protein
MKIKNIALMTAFAVEFTTKAIHKGGFCYEVTSNHVYQMDGIDSCNMLLSDFTSADFLVF